MNPSRRKGRKGFTLIELLVVIAILAVIAALLFPVFNSATGKARQTTCLSNFKQIGQSFMMYTQDYSETLPPGQTGPYASTDWKIAALWPQLLAPYVKDWRIYACPDDPGANDATYRLIMGVPANASGAQLEFARSFYTDFGYNHVFLSPTQVTNGISEFRPVSLSAIKNSSSTILGIDSSSNRNEGPGEYLVYAPTIYNYWQGETKPGNSPYGWVWPRHAGNANVAFADGHCKALNIGALTAGVNLTNGVITDTNACLWDLD
jgi:prepilin-type N-terminal cleavage/methylation domain-containing protein/prepilin-type processing-associated H-X9-DG protein